MQLKDKKNKSLSDYIFNWRTGFALGLVLISLLLYFIHYQVFEDLHHILIFFVEDIAFIPIEVLIVTLIIHRLLEARDKQRMLKKLNMVIGAFYSEVGNELIRKLSSLDPESNKIENKLQLDDSWTNEDFNKIQQEMHDYQYSIVVDKEQLRNLKEFLTTEKSFLLNLLKNPNLLEHDTFTDLLWAVFHLTEELMYRENFKNMSEEDREHLEEDIKRVYVQLVEEWLFYMEHLKEDYPYLFSLAIRTNPFNPKAKVEIE
ncbi:hypothetical protein [Sporohalobacter salinus]|uniref:hypothetical protein n=1 Tax=Sporohalobacter salinus TaxID=1494606 RepID=UPI00195F2C95|nr:hypothetical protein [Sporohalobacter salinus]MBM7623622.1 hypothetical protein [Sporohalobacter salinus]